MSDVVEETRKTRVTTLDPKGLAEGLVPARPSIITKHDGLFTDTCNMLDHKMLAHMAMWAYLNGGRPHLEKFFDSPDYDGKKEEAIIPIIGRNFAWSLPDEISLIELGPGKAFSTKTREFIKSFNRETGSKKRVVEYLAVDIVEDYADAATKYIGEKFYVPTKKIIGDYTHMNGPIKTLATPVLISWNSPIWNSPIAPGVEPDFIYASNLKKLGQLVGEEGIAILTHFPLRDVERSHRIHMSEDCKQAVLAIANLVGKRLSPECFVEGETEPTSFSDIFRYNVEVDLEKEFIDMNLLAKAETTVSMGDYETLLHSDETFSAVRSGKPSIEHFNRISEIGGARVINTVQTPDGSVVGQALRFSR